MSLTINKRESGNVVILDLNGQITLGDTAASLRDTVRQLLEEGRKNILLNLAAVPYMDSSGLGQLVGSFATVTSRGGQFKLVNLQTKLQSLMYVTKLIALFDVYADEATALHSFSTAASA